ncbi:MAG: hypothetical protein Q8O97_01215 [bacterium]|nr:hypothetical protein [Candidatus Wildermuthbacteria bacterium]MDP2664572.1 hypothetical protein [bacterium]
MTSSKQSDRIFAIDVGDLYLKFLFMEKNRAVLWGREELNVIFWRRPLEHIWEMVQNFFLSWKEKEQGSVVLGFSPSSLKASFVSHTLSRQSSGPITAIEEQSLLKEFQKVLEGKALETLSQESGIRKEDFVLERFTVLEKKIDGYAVPSFKDFKGKEVTLRGLGVFLLRSHHEILEYIVRQYKLGAPLLSHEAESLTLFAKEKGLDALFLDVGDTHTSFSLVVEQSLALSDVLPFGGDRFTQILMRSLGMKANIAREFKEKYVKGQLSEDLRARIKELFLPEARNLVTLIQERMQKNGLAFSYPVFLFGGGALLEELKEAAQEQVQDVSLLLPKDVFAVQNFPPELNPQYTPLVLQVYYARQKIS